MPKINKFNKKRQDLSSESEAESNSDERTLPVSDETESEETMPIPEEIIYPGLVLAEDYVLLKKIGFGNNATVWMAYHVSAKTYVAIKIQCHECYNDGCREVAIIRKINDYCKKKNEDIHCVTMLNFFAYEADSDRKFVCSVYDLYAGSLQMLLDSGKYKYGLPIPVVKSIIRQLLIALSTLHGTLAIIHTDIKPQNILFKGVPEYHNTIITAFSTSGFDQKYEEIKKDYQDNHERFTEELDILALDSIKCLSDIDVMIQTEEFIPDESEDSDDFINGESDDSSYNSEYSDSEDTHAFNERNQSINDVIEILDYKEMHDFDKETDYDFDSVLNNRHTSSDKESCIDDKYVDNCQIALTDFGNAYFFDKRTKNEVQDRFYRAPEVILDFNYKYACDMWSVACVTFELLTGFVLFEVEETPINKDINHLYLIEKNLGKMPLKMKKTSKRHNFLFDKKRNYHIKNLEPFVEVPLRDRLVNQFLFTDQEANDINDFLTCGLCYNPEDRFNASELLKHVWLN